MPINIINSQSSESLTQGEKYTLDQKLRKVLRDDAYVYVQPTINGIKPDFVVLDKTSGITIIEVKDWSDEHLEFANKRQVICNGTKYRNPLVQVTNYAGAIESVASIIDEFVDNEGVCSIPIHRKVFFPNLSATKGHSFATAFEDANISIFYEKDLKKLSLSDFYSDTSQELSDIEINALRGVLFPEIQIPSKQLRSDDEFLYIDRIQALDKDQEEFAKKIPNGHYMVTGLPGSGKTVMLLTRALHQAQEQPDWSIAILTYTSALADKLKTQLKQKIDEMNLPGSLIDQIEIITFHKLCHNLVGKLHKPAEMTNDEFFNHYWPKKSLQALSTKKSAVKYDSILIDEYQDFHACWFELCRSVCNQQEGIENIFLAGDRLQRIYNVPWSSYKEIGIHIQGRSKLLKRPYRTNPSHMDFALKFLSINESLARDINKFYELDTLNNIGSMEKCLTLINDKDQTLGQYLHNLVNVNYIHPSDILVLFHNKFEYQKEQDKLPIDLRLRATTGKEPEEGKMHFTTYYSAKGLEARYCILYGTDLFTTERTDRILMYVGMTRASDKLAIHYSSDNGLASDVLSMLSSN